jgi:O-antigen ligase
MSARLDIPRLQRPTFVSMCWLAILIGLSVPVSVAFDNVLLALLLLGALASLGSITRVASAHPVARAALLLFALLSVAMFYGEASIKVAFATLAKYVDLLFIPVFIFLLANVTAQRRARYAFLAAMGVTLVLSCLVGWKLLPVMSWMSAANDPGSAIIFHSRITQNNMMAFAAFLALLESRDAATTSKRIAWGLFALLGVANVLFMVQGRTGYLILLSLLVWFVWSSVGRHQRQLGRSWGWKQAIIIALVFSAASLLAYNASQRLHERVSQMIAEYQQWVPNQARETSSTGQRLDYYANTLQIVEQHALVGVGTGGFAEAFRQQVQGTGVVLTNNPHNEFLFIAVQTGMPGLALLLYLLYTQWRCAPRLPSALEQDAARGLVLAYLVNCMFNSALHDHADGLFFAFMTAVLFAGLKQEPARG